MAKKLTLIRHAALPSEHHGCYIGRRDIPLSRQGIHQAERLAQHFSSCRAHPIDSVWCSPALRARQTAQPLTQQLSCPIIFDERLHEVDFGRWEGLNFEQICRSDPQLVDQWADFSDDFSFPAGESLRQFNQRITGMTQALRVNDCRHLAVVSHGGTIRSLICHLLGWPIQDHLKFSIERGGYATLELDDSHALLTGLYNHAIAL